MVEKRVNVKFRVKLGKSATESLNMFGKAYGDEAMSCLPSLATEMVGSSITTTAALSQGGTRRPKTTDPTQPPCPNLTHPPPPQIFEKQASGIGLFLSPYLPPRHSERG